MTTYRERREARAERLREWSEKNKGKAEAASGRADAISGMIPMGQPILTGHHSEGRHRRDLDRIHSGHRKAGGLRERAVDQASRADGIDRQLEISIYSDDHDAIEKLAGRLSVLESERDRIKAYNASCRKAAKTDSMGDMGLLDEKQRADILSIARMTGYNVKPGGGFPAYILSNLSGRIKRDRDRLAGLVSREETA